MVQVADVLPLLDAAQAAYEDVAERASRLKRYQVLYEVPETNFSDVEQAQKVGPQAGVSSPLMCHLAYHTHSCAAWRIIPTHVLFAATVIFLIACRLLL